MISRWFFGRSTRQAALVQEVFDEFGIPAAVESHAKLNRSPLLQALVGVVRLAAEDWPYRQLLAVLSNNYFQPSWPEWRQAGTAVATEWAVRQLQVPRGRGELLAALEWRTQSGRDRRRMAIRSMDDEMRHARESISSIIERPCPCCENWASALENSRKRTAAFEMDWGT